MATQVIEELLVSLGVDVDKDLSAKIDQFSGRMENAAKNIAKIAAVATAAAAGVTAFVSAVSRSVDELGKLSELTGIAVDDIEALKFAMDISTGSSDGLSSSLENFARVLSEAKRGIGQGIEPLGILGIDPNQRQSTLEFLMQIADSIAAIGDPNIQIEFADKLGLRDLTLLLQKGSSGMAGLIDRGKQLAVVTEEDARRAAIFNDTLHEGVRVIKGVGVTIASALSPIIAGLVADLTRWWVVNKDIIRQNLTRFIEGLDTAFRVLTVTIGILLTYQLGSFFIGVTSAVRILTAALATLNIAMVATWAKAAIAPLAVGAAILLIIGLIDELITMFTGGETIIRGFFEWLYERIPFLETLLMPVATTVQFLIDLVMTFVDLLSDPLNGDNWGQFFSTLRNLILSFVTDMSNAVIDVIEGLVNGVVKAINKIPGININAGGGIQIPRVDRSKLEDLVTGLASASPGNIAALAAPGLQAVTGGTTNNRTVQLSQNVQLTVSAGGADGYALGRQIKQVLEEQAQQAQLNLDNGLKL